MRQAVNGGRLQLGQFIHLTVSTVDGSGVPTNPTSAPTITIYDSSDNRIINAKPIAPQGINRTGLFGIDLMLSCQSTLGVGYGSVEFTSGQYVVLYKWTIGGTERRAIDRFEILPGGNCKGAYTALEFYERPQADYLVGATEDGTVETRRGPYLP